MADTPDSDFVASPLSGVARLDVTITPNAQEASEERICGHYWDFGDGEYSSEVAPKHRYASPGKYSVRHTVTGVDGSVITTTKTLYISVTEWSEAAGGRNASLTTRCFLCGFNVNQGIGFSEITGESFPMPGARAGVVSVVDDNMLPRLLVMDQRDGMFYDVATFDGPTGLGSSKVWLDKVSSAGVGGTAIKPKVTFREDTGNVEYYFLKSLKNHFFFRPVDENNRNDTGYDSKGYPTGFSVDVSVFVDGEPDTATATVDDISVPKNQLTYDRQVVGNRLQTVIEASDARVRLVGRLQEFVRLDTPDAPTNLLMTADAIQEDLSTPKMWIGYARNNLVNLVTGGSVVANVTRISGLDGRSNSAQQFTVPITLGTVTIENGTVMVWYQGTIAVTIGGSAVTLVSGGTSGDWTLGYADSVALSGSVVITPTGTGKIFDFRAYNDIISAAARLYYYGNVNTKSGDIVLPRF